MELKKFREHIESFPQGTLFNYGISSPFSWRGSYDEVAFDMLEQPMTREEILAKIQLVYTETFKGYEGGEYTYCDFVNIHFEPDKESWTGGDYTSRWIEKIKDTQEYQSDEEILVKMAFVS